MNLSIGDTVVYGNAGICRVESTEKRSFDGVHTTEYYKLLPVSAESSVYYIPVTGAADKLRPLMSRDEILALIDSMPALTPLWSTDAHERKALFQSVLKSDDYSQLIRMLKSIHVHRKSRLDAGKRLLSADEAAMKTAERILYQEFSTVLSIPLEQVEGFISKRLTPETLAG